MADLHCSALPPGASGRNCWEELCVEKQQAQLQARRVQGYQILGGLGLLPLEGSMQ